MKRMWSKNELLRLSDAEIRKLIESGEIDNAKPIYCHPITIIGPYTSLHRITCLIFNNSEVAFTKTTFLDYIDSLYEEAGSNIRIMTSGALLSGEKVIILSNMGKTATDYFFTGVASDGSDSSQTYTRAQMEALIDQFFDGVNKIN